jgi:hypothetical protein
MGYKREQVEKMAASLRAMPAIEPPPKDLSKKEVIGLLSKEIRSLQKRGYTLEQIASSLKGEGLDISTYTLKSYMNKPKQTGKSSGGVKSLRGSGSTTSHQPAAKIAAPTESGSDGASENPDRTAEVEPPPAGKTNYVSKSKLAPRPDSENI